MTALRALVGRVLEVSAADRVKVRPRQYVLFDDRIRAVGPASALPSGDISVEDLGERLIAPGFVDTHVHLPQLPVVAMDGLPLLDWLDRFIFPAEARYADEAVAEAGARAFFQALTRAGTVAASVFTSLHERACDLAFHEAEASGLTIQMGKPLMDVPNAGVYFESAEEALAGTERLAARWHGAHGRLFVAVTPRFALSTTRELLAGAGRLAQTLGLPVQTHVSENPDEVREVARRFPEFASYAHTYDAFGLLTPRTILAHGVHLTDAEIRLLHERGAGVALCPASNLFLGSGWVAQRRLEAAGVRVGLGSDVGAGPSLLMLTHMRALVDVAKARRMFARDAGQELPAALAPAEAFYHATLGAAALLGFDDRLGSLEPGKLASLVVLDPAATAPAPEFPPDDDALLSWLVHRGQDNAVRRTYVEGRLAYSRDET